jgi:hypothetical protein
MMKGHSSMPPETKAMAIRKMFSVTNVTTNLDPPQLRDADYKIPA